MGVHGMQFAECVEEGKPGGSLGGGVGITEPAVSVKAGRGVFGYAPAVDEFHDETRHSEHVARLLDGNHLGYRGPGLPRGGQNPSLSSGVACVDQPAVVGGLQYQRTCTRSGSNVEPPSAAGVSATDALGCDGCEFWFDGRSQPA